MANDFEVVAITLQRFSLVATKLSYWQKLTMKSSAKLLTVLLVMSDEKRMFVEAGAKGAQKFGKISCSTNGILGQRFGSIFEVTRKGLASALIYIRHALGVGEGEREGEERSRRRARPSSIVQLTDYLH